MTDWTVVAHPRSHKIKDLKGQKIRQWDDGVPISETLTDTAGETVIEVPLANPGPISANAVSVTDGGSPAQEFISDPTRTTSFVVDPPGPTFWLMVPSVGWIAIVDKAAGLGSTPVGGIHSDVAFRIELPAPAANDLVVDYEWRREAFPEITEMVDGVTLWGDHQATVSSVSGDFTARETLNFSGGAAGTYVVLSGSLLTFGLVSGTPVVGDTITGASSGVTATVDAVGKI